MSLVNQSGRRSASPMTIEIPAQYTKDYESMVMFDEIKTRMYELWSVVNDSSEVKPIDSDFTTEGSQIILATNSITITLRINPLDQEKVQIKNTGGIITINGNGRNIDGSDILIVDKLWDAPTLIFLQEQDKWYIF